MPNFPPTNFFLGFVSLSIRSRPCQTKIFRFTAQFCFLFRSIKLKIVQAPAYFTNYRLRCLSTSKVSVSASQRYRKQQNYKPFIESFLQQDNFANFSTSKQVNQKSITMKPEFERLPKSVSPSHYELQLQPDLINFTFAGSSKTTIKVSEVCKYFSRFASQIKMKIQT